MKKTGTGTTGENCYLRVTQAGVGKGGASDYYLHSATWAATGGAVADTVFGYLEVTNGGHANTPEEFSGELVIDCNDGTRAGVTGITRWINNGGQRCVSIHGHQVLVNAAKVDGFLLGFVGTGNFVAGVGRIVVEGLRK